MANQSFFHKPFVPEILFGTYIACLSYLFGLMITFPINRFVFAKLVEHQTLTGKGTLSPAVLTATGLAGHAVCIILAVIITSLLFRRWQARLRSKVFTAVGVVVVLGLVNVLLILRPGYMG